MTPHHNDALETLGLAAVAAFFGAIGIVAAIVLAVML